MGIARIRPPARATSTDSTESWSSFCRRCGSCCRASRFILGFLLTVPLTERFTRLTWLQTSTYFSVFIATPLAAAFLVAPSAYHRLRWRQYDKELLLRVANKFAIAGLPLFRRAQYGEPGE